MDQPAFPQAFSWRGRALGSRLLGIGDRLSAEGLARAALPLFALALLAMLGISALVAARTERNLREAARMQALRAATDDLFVGLLSLESAQRGYLLTGKDTYRAPYDQAVTRVPALLASLTAMVPAADPDAKLFRQLDTLARAKMAELARTLSLAAAGSRDAALAIVRSDRGQTVMDAIRGIGDQLAPRQRAVLEQDLTRSRAAARQVAVVNGLTVLLLILLGGALVTLARRDLRRLAQARASLQLANEALEAGHARLDQAVRDRTLELTLANEEVQRFAYIVSHDLRAPLLNVIGFTSELEVALLALRGFVDHRIGAGDAVPADVREATETDLPEAIRFIQTSSAKMDRLITAILQLSREGRRVLTPEPIDMAAFLAAIADTLRHRADANGAAITVGEVPALVSDRLATEQVFGNLMDNALKYLSPDRPGRIRVSGWRDESDIVYEVADNGRGIDARDFDRIFDLFRRAGVQDTQGEGIGLAHVRALVRRLGGRIDCASTLGRGSTFTVRLPAVLPHQTEFMG